jgi:hypothetical protein
MHVTNFDKLCLLSGLIWNRLAESGLVSFNIPYIDKPGIHGHGAALQTNPAFATEDFIQHVLVKFYAVFRNLTRRLFDFTPMPMSAESPVNTVESTLFQGDIDNYVGDDDDSLLTATDKTFVKRLSGIVAKLTEQEIRALGVHSDERTIEALEYNAVYWLNTYEGAARSIQAGKAVSSEAFHTLKQLVAELQDKAGATEKANRNHHRNYAKGWKKLQRLVGNDGQVKAAVEAVLPNKAEFIWGQKTVRDWKVSISSFRLFTDYLIGLEAFLVGKGRGDSVPATANIKEAVNARNSLRAMSIHLPAFEEFAGADKNKSCELLAAALKALECDLPPLRFPQHWKQRKRREP